MPSINQDVLALLHNKVVFWRDQQAELINESAKGDPDKPPRRLYLLCCGARPCRWDYLPGWGGGVGRVLIEVLSGSGAVEFMVVPKVPPCLKNT